MMLDTPELAEIVEMTERALSLRLETKRCGATCFSTVLQASDLKFVDVLPNMKDIESPIVSEYWRATLSWLASAAKGFRQAQPRQMRRPSPRPRTRSPLSSRSRTLPSAP